MRPDGSDARLLAPSAESMSWSGDSRWLAYVGDGSIWKVARAGGAPQRLADATGVAFPTLSPHGRALAFIGTGPRGWRLVVQRDGRQTTVDERAHGVPAWSLDGKWIAIRDGDRGALSLVRPTGGPPRLLVLDMDSPFEATTVWSPDGRRLAYEDFAGIHVVSRSGRGRVSLVHGVTRGLAWSPRGDAIAYLGADGPALVETSGNGWMLARAEAGESQRGIGWTTVRRGDHYRVPEPPLPLVEVSERDLRAAFPIRSLSADGDRVAYWLCPHVLGAWRPGDARQVPLGSATLPACRIASDPLALGSYVYDLALAGDRLGYLTRGGSNTTVWQLRSTSLDRGDEGVAILTAAETAPQVPRLENLLAGGSTLVYGVRGLTVTDWGVPESIWRIDGATPVQVARRPYDLQPLALDGGRIVVRRADGSLELLDLLGGVLRTLDVPALGAALAGDDLVVVAKGELRDYSASTGMLLHAWPLPDVPSSGRCLSGYCPGIRLTLDDAARGLALYTLDGVVHLLRLRDRADVTVPGATAADLTDAGLFYAYTGEEPWPGRIRFVPFAELPLR